MLRVVAGLFEELNENQIDDILSGKGRLVYELQSRTLTEREPRLLNNFEDIINRLSNCKDREEAREILSSVPNKKTLTAIAKSQKIHVVKNDRREDIEDKLIEFIIGAKLRTEAIHSLNLKGGSENS